tara:strand:- start:154 stop:564 length:411 start_codon:yes stop_codon:yes gene_type:complete
MIMIIAYLMLLFVSTASAATYTIDNRSEFDINWLVIAIGSADRQASSIYALGSSSFESHRATGLLKAGRFDQFYLPSGASDLSMMDIVKVSGRSLLSGIGCRVNLFGSSRVVVFSNADGALFCFSSAPFHDGVNRW